MNLTQFITNRTQARRVGIFVQDIAPSRVIRARGRKKVLIVGHFPWGPTGTVWDVTSEAAFLDRHYPVAQFGSGSGTDANTAYSETFGLLSPGISKVYNVAGSSGAKASFTFVDDDGTPENSLVITAAYNGVIGNLIRASVSANVTDSTKRDVRIYITADDGTIVYDVTYFAVQNANGTVNTVSPVNTTTLKPESLVMVTITAASGANEAAAVLAGQALTGGSVDTYTAANFNAGVIKALESDSDIGIVVCVGVADSLAAALNELIQTAAEASGSNGVIFTAVERASRTKAEHLADALLCRTERIRYIGPQVTRTTAYNHRGYSATYTATCSGRLIWAMMRTATEYHRATMQGGTPSGFAGAISGLEATWTGVFSDFNDFAEAGVIGWIKDDNGIYVPFDDVANYLIDGVPAAGERLIHQDYYDGAFNAFLASFLGSGKVDVQLPSETLPGALGDHTGGVIAKMRDFLDAERGRGILQRQPDATTGVLDDGYIVDGITDNESADVGAGRWAVRWAARATPNARSIVVNRRLDNTITF